MATSSIAALVVPGRRVPNPANPCQWLELGRALTAEVRAQYGIAAQAHTVAVGWTSVDGLVGERFVGASRTIRAAVPLPHPTPHIVSPRANAQFLDHAEQDVANAFIDAAEGANLATGLEHHWLRIFVSHARGPCSACAQGLDADDVAPGVLGQLSRRYADLTVTLAWEMASGSLGFVILQGGQRLL